MAFRWEDLRIYCFLVIKLSKLVHNVMHLKNEFVMCSINISILSYILSFLPGVVNTVLTRNMHVWQRILLMPVAKLFFLDAEAGSQTTLHCALQMGIEPLSGRYFSCCRPQQVGARGRDDGLARKLWEVSERLTS